MRFEPVRFINQPVEVEFATPPALEKVPGCPDGFTWSGARFHISEMLSEWHDYRRRGKMARNMRPSHAVRAASHGSWGVGLDYFRVRTNEGRIFDLYYDRAPQDADRRKGGWFIEKELAAHPDAEGET